MRVILICFTVLLLAPSDATANTFTPSHSCLKPHKPYQFNSEFQLDNFRRDVEQYKQCIADFVDEQERASRKHLAAADEAIEEWNWYVQYELN